MTRLMLAAMAILLLAQPSMSAEPALVQKGLDLMNRGAYPQAISSFTKAIVADPSDLQARRLLCSALLKNGMATAAAQQLETINKFAPGNAVDCTMLGDAYFHCGESSKAVDAYKKAIAADPSMATAKYGLARALMSTGDMNGARSLAINTLKSTSDQRIRSGCAQLLSQIRERSVVQSETVGNG